MKIYIVLVEDLGKHFDYDDEIEEYVWVGERYYTTYQLCKEPKFHVHTGVDVYDSYTRLSYAKVRAYKENYAWFNRLEKDNNCHWYGVQSHTCQQFSIAFSCLAVDPETGEVIRVMVYNTGMNVYVWKIADNLGE